MEGFEIQPVLRSALPEVAEFLYQWRNTEAEKSPDKPRVDESALAIERRLRWLLVENPAAKESPGLGYCILDRAGVIRGLNLTFPAAFLAADQKLTGLCAGSFFVDPPARSLGFFLFRKYLATPGCSFFFATTCNAESGALWTKLGGKAVPHSETEYFLPLKLDALAQEFTAARTSNRIAAQLARLAGHCANPLLRLLNQSSTQLTIKPCQDWEKLAELSRRHRSPDCITTDRSAEFLEWRYGSGSPLHPSAIYTFQDQQGREGWFALANLIRGEQGLIRGSVLLDAIWPRESLSFRPILQEIVRFSAAGSDAIFFRPQPGMDFREYSRLAIPRSMPSPRAFVMTRKGAPLPAVESLEYDDSDDVAWKFQWTAARGKSVLPQAVPEPGPSGKKLEGLTL